MALKATYVLVRFGAEELLGGLDKSTAFPA